jgi:hypothetical protein
MYGKTHPEANELATPSLEIGGFGDAFGQELKRFQETVGGSSNDGIQHGGQ